MRAKIKEEINKILNSIVPDNEIAKGLLRYNLECFADLVESVVRLEIRKEMQTSSTPYSPEEVRHG